MRQKWTKWVSVFVMIVMLLSVILPSLSVLASDEIVVTPRESDVKATDTVNPEVSLEGKGEEDIPDGILDAERLDESSEEPEDSGIIVEEHTSDVGNEIKVEEQAGGVLDTCYISAYEIDEMLDGSAPFDEDTARGNDDSASNQIVRSFDSVNYTLKYTTAIRDETTTGVDSAYVYVDFYLPLDPKEATWNEDTMQWALDKKITYVYEDGSQSETWDKTKDVAGQRFTGKRFLQNTEAGNTVPGTGTLSVGVNVWAASEGQVLQPDFTIWMEGNPEEEKQTVVGEEVRITAAPKYNINLRSSSGVDFLGEFDLESGQILDEQTDTSVSGRLSGYPLVVQLYNTTANKGMRGIEFPSGDITFDIRLKSELNGADVTTDPDYQLRLWDYIENNMGTVGKLGRNMQPTGGSGYAYYGPGNKGNGDAYCYDGGNIIMEQDGDDPYLYHVTVKDYQFDWDDFDFPTRYLWSNAGTVTYAENVGCFSAGNLVFLSEFPRQVETTSTLYSDITVSNLHVESNGEEEVTEMVSSDNKVRKHIVLYPSGTIAKYMRYYSNTSSGNPGTYLSSIYSAGDNATWQGNDIWIESFIHGKAEYSWSDFNLLQKFDDECIDIKSKKFKYSSSYMKDKGSISILYVAKPDKSGWDDDMEMNLAREEDLIYFKSIDDLKSAGYTCVAVLYEIRGCDTRPVSAYVSYFTMYVPATVKKTAEVGSVYQLVSDLRAWRHMTATQPFSWTDMVYDKEDGSYGLGEEDFSGYVDGYQKPYMSQLTKENSYTKVSYKDGTLYGHTGGYQMGNSLLIVGDKVGVSISGADISGDTIKHVYDLDAGERTALFKVQPTCELFSENEGSEVEGMKDTLRVEVTLPADLHLNETGISLTPDEVTVNEDGTTSIVWILEDVIVGESIDPITFSVTIGEEGTVNDVKNNDAFTVSAEVTSENDIRATTAENGNYSETSISVIKLAASSVTKRVLQPLVESGQEIGFRLRYSNLSEIEAEQVVLYDILSYVKDMVGSDFSGDYRLTRITMDYAHAPKTYEESKSSLSVWLTEDEKARTDEVRDEVLDGNLKTVVFEKISGKWNEKQVVFDKITQEDATALALQLGDVFGNEYVDVYFYLSPMKSNGSGLMEDAAGKVQQPGDVYANRFYQNSQNQAAVVISNVVEAVVVNRVISGLVWLDKDHDGVQDAEDLFEGAGIQLYRTTPSGFDDKGDSVSYEGMTLYPAYDVFGKPVNMIRTGKDGSYVFDYLEAGTYVVVVSDTDGYYLTDKDTGEDDSVDSDATSADGGGYISEIVLPELENMTESTFVSEHHDTGLVRHTEMVIRKETASGELLSGAELSIYHEKDIVDGKPLDDAVPIDTWVSDGTEHVLRDVLLAGDTYVLYEEKAPDGYLLADPVVFTVKDTDKPQEIVMVDAYRTSSLTLHKLDESGNDLSGVTFRLTFLEAKGDVRGSYLLEEGESLEQTTDASGQVRFENLNRGLYEVTEVKTVDGQTLLPEPIQVELPMAFTEEELEDHPDVDLTDAVQIEDTWYFFDVTYEITNRANLAMPVAGGQPTVVYLGLCLGLVCMACLFRLIYRKR